MGQTKRVARTSAARPTMLTRAVHGKLVLVPTHRNANTGRFVGSLATCITELTHELRAYAPTALTPQSSLHHAGCRASLGDLPRR